MTGDRTGSGDRRAATAAQKSAAIRRCIDDMNAETLTIPQVKYLVNCANGKEFVSHEDVARLMMADSDSGRLRFRPDGSFTRARVF